MHRARTLRSPLLPALPRRRNRRRKQSCRPRNRRPRHPRPADSTARRRTISRGNSSAFGPHPPDTDAIRRMQDYIVSQLKGFGCAVDTDDFHASSSMGSLAMGNIIAKIPGTGQGIIVLLTHYDTLRLDNFVGADDSGSSSGLMLEMARLLCAEKTGSRTPFGLPSSMAKRTSRISRRRSRPRPLGTTTTLCSAAASWPRVSPFPEIRSAFARSSWPI